MGEPKGLVSKFFGFLFVFAIVMWVATDHVQAAEFAKNAITFLQRMVIGLLSFLTDLTKQTN